MSTVVERTRRAKRRQTNGERLWTTGEVAAELGVHRNTVRNWVLLGRFPAYRRSTSREILIPDSEVQRLKELHLVFDAVGGLSDDDIEELRQERRGGQ